MLPLSSLDELRERYMSLLSAVQSGQLPHDQALAQLRSLHAVDGAGARWQITQQGQYTRVPAGQHETLPADPSEWVTAAVAPAAAVGFPSDGAPSATGLPGGVPGGLLSGAGLPSDLNAAPVMAGAGALFPAEQQTEQVLPSGKGRKSRHRPAGLSTAEPKRPLLDIADLFEQHKKTLVVFGAGCMLLLAATLATSEDIPNDSGIPVVQPTAPVIAPLPSAAPTTPVAPGTKAAAVPTVNDITRVLSALTSGKRDLVQSAVAVPGNGPTVAATTALFAGFGPAQMELAPGAASAVGGSIQSRVEVRDVATKTVYGGFTFTWTKTGSGWVLAAWPAFR